MMKKGYSKVAKKAPVKGRGKGFKPCSKCPTPAKCKAAGKCKLKSR